LFRTGDDTKMDPNPNFNMSSTSSYLDLAPLYGNNDQEQQAVRTLKDGMLKPDTFSEFRILEFPPGVSALLVLFNRFHNYVAGELKRINEGGRFTPNPRLSKEEAEKKVDHDLFNITRLYVQRST
jgi:linoleate 8R-lipoxygenase/9,12-octadecadienoate 8-hydroperoxide 8R-isomerase